jgi:hypothetical protein
MVKVQICTVYATNLTYNLYFSFPTARRGNTDNDHNNNVCNIFTFASSKITRLTQDIDLTISTQPKHVSPSAKLHCIV